MSIYETLPAVQTEDSKQQRYVLTSIWCANTISIPYTCHVVFYHK